ncbi:MAG: GC-type dockerin domain-anchored protein [Planctomycetota bacterium]
MTHCARAQVTLDPSPFPSLATPADAVVGDVAGFGPGGPDGIPDLVIAYPQLPGTQLGGVAVLVGTPGEGQCGLQPFALYTGKGVDTPVAVEIGDFTGDGTPEIVFANRGDFSGVNSVRFLGIDASAPEPLQLRQRPTVPIARDRRISDLAVISLADQLRRTSRQTLLILSSGSADGTASAATFDTVNDDWDVCDIDVCDDPDSFDPIDPDGAGALLGEGFASTSGADDKVVVASNTGGMPDTFPTETFGVASDPGEVQARDLNGDGFPDIALVSTAAGSATVLLNVAAPASPGGRSFGAPITIDLRDTAAGPDPAPSSIAAADLDDDGDLDLAVVSTAVDGSRAVRLVRNLLIETGSFGLDTAVTIAQQPPGVPVLVRPFDADGSSFAVDDDLIVLTEPPSPRGSGASAGVVLCSREDCPADVNGDGQLTPADFSAWIAAFNAGDPAADQNGDGLITPSDFSAWIANYNAGC